MGPIQRILTLVFLLASSITVLAAQSAAVPAHEGDGTAAAGRSTTDRAAGLPRTMRFSGVVRGADQAARSGVVALTFTLYSEAQGGAPVWVETQNVTLDENGRYTAMLGATSAKGLPVALFAHGEARWLGVRVAEEGAAEQARVQLVSVPYALAAADAHSLGGRPATDFQLTRTAATASGDGAAPGVVVSPTVNTTSNTVNRVARFTGVDTVGDSQIFDNGSNIGIGTTTPSALFHVNAVAGDAFNLYTSTTVGGSVAVYANHFGAASIGYAGFFSKTGAGTTNIGLYAEASGGTNNYAALFQGGNVGIGTSSPVAKLQVNATNQDAINIYSTATGGGSVALYAEHSGASPLGYAGYFNKTGAGTTNIGLVGSASGAANNYAALFPSGRVGIGTSAPTQPLEVAGTIYSTTGGFKFPDGSTQLTAATSSAGDITSVVAGNGLAGGATSGDATLNIKTCAEGQVLKYVGTTWTCSADQTGAGGIVYPYSSGNQSTSSGAFLVTQTNSTILVTNPTFASAQSGIPAAIVGKASNTTNTAVGVVGFSSSPDSPAIVGWNGATVNPGDSDGPGVIGQSDMPGGTGVDGTSEATTGTGRGVQGQSRSPNGVGVYGSNSAGGLAGKFDGPVQILSSLSNPNGQFQITGGLQVVGNLNVQGTLTKQGGTFKIDHPLDPANKYLYHSFVESPDMMNIYNGVIVLDAKGQAWVTMPEWFEALNMEFRYQLTAIGRPAPNLYVAKEMSGNRFKIAGGGAKAKISWQVTGIRHDAWAQANRTVVEVEKPAKEQGTYLFPGGFLKPVVAQK